MSSKSRVENGKNENKTRFNNMIKTYNLTEYHKKKTKS